MDVPPVSAAAPATPAAPGAAATPADMSDAFAVGIAKFMGTMMPGFVSDVQEACNDTVSTPDAPS